jgi:hypothetical protein
MKVIPKNSNDSNDSNDSMDLESNKKKYSLFDYDKDGKVDINDMFKKCNSWLKYISFLYDVSVDNLPFGSIIGLTLTIVSTCLISTGMGNSVSIISKYNENENLGYFINYYSLSLLCYIVLHVCVLLHGISICTLETSRELCQRSEVGCYFGCCKNKNTCFGKFCRCYQKCARVSVQAVWGVVGTLLMFIFYFLSVSYFVFSTLSTTVSYYLKSTCKIFSNTINTYKNNALNYVKKAKLHINSADAVALTILSEYNNWVNMQQKFLESGMGQIQSIDGPGISGSPEHKELWTPNEPNNYDNYQEENVHCNCGRHLMVNNATSFSPLQKIADGRSILSILNESIYQTESQIYYYDGQFKMAETVCYDYSSIYDSLYLISIGTGLLLLAQFIMFAVHYKYFSVWNYEVKLTKLNGYHITKK